MGTVVIDSVGVDVRLFFIFLCFVYFLLSLYLFLCHNMCLNYCACHVIGANGNHFSEENKR